MDTAYTGSVRWGREGLFQSLRKRKRSFVQFPSVLVTKKLPVVRENVGSLPAPSHMA